MIPAEPCGAVHLGLMRPQEFNRIEDKIPIPFARRTRYGLDQPRLLKSHHHRLFKERPMRLIFIAANGINADRVGIWNHQASKSNARVEVVPDRLEHSSAIAKADVVIFQSEWPKGLDIQRCAECKLIIHAGAGADKVNLRVARDLGIFVSSVPDFATPELTALTMQGLKQIALHQFQSAVPHRDSNHLGLIGLGQVGCAVAVAAQEIGWDVWAHDPFVHPESFTRTKVKRATLDDLLGIAHVVSLHLPYVESEPTFVGRDFIQAMKRGARLVNTSHAGLTDIGVVIEELRKGKIGAAHLFRANDEATTQDLIQEEKLRWLDSGVLRSPAVQSRAVEMAVQIGLSFLSGTTPKHLLIDPPLPRAVLGETSQM